METGQVHSGPGRQGSQAGYEVQRLEDDMGGAIPIGSFQLLADVAIGRER